MSFIPPTPAVKVEIARGKSAVDLGWSQTFYERFCWQYGLQPIRPEESVATLIAQAVKEPEPPKKQSLTGDPFRDAIVERWGRGERRNLTIEYLAGGAGKTRTTFEVSRHEAAALIVISRSIDQQGWVTAADIVRFEQRAVNTGTATSISQAYRQLSRRLIKSPLDLQTTNGKGARIVFANRKTLARVRVVALGDIEIE